MGKPWRRSEVGVEIGGSGGSSCSGFIVSVNSTTGVITATTSQVSYSGSKVGYVAPTWVQTEELLDHESGGGVVDEAGTFLVWVKITYSANTGSFGSAWNLDAVEFDFGETRPANVEPTFDFSTQTWSGAGTFYSDWATITDREVLNSFGGGIILKICTPEEIILQHGCSV